MQAAFPHERLEVYQRYLTVTGQCEELVSQAPASIAALDHLDRAVESIGVNLMRANTLQPGSPRRSSYLDVSIASTHECAACLDVCFARRVVEAKTQVSLEGVGWIHDFLKELDTKARTRGKLDVSTTGTVLNIAEGHGRTTPADQNRFMKTAEEHAFQTILILDLMVARQKVEASRIECGKAIQARVISMLHSWCAKNGGA